MTGWLAAGWTEFRSLCAAVWADRGLRWFIVVLVLCDLLSIAYFGVGKLLFELGLDPFLYNHKELLITTDGGIPEWFNYLKTVLLVLTFFRMARATREPIYAAFTLVYLVVVLDDAMEIHEKAGKSLAHVLALPRLWGLRSREVGEVITWAIFGMLLVPPLLIGLARSSATHRRKGLAMIVPFGALMFCAIVIDQLYTNYNDLFVGAGVLLDVLEDGGEMLSISGACALALAAERQRHRAPS